MVSSQQRKPMPVVPANVTFKCFWGSLKRKPEVPSLKQGSEIHVWNETVALQRRRNRCAAVCNEVNKWDNFSCCFNTGVWIDRNCKPPAGRAQHHKHTWWMWDCVEDESSWSKSSPSLCNTLNLRVIINNHLEASFRFFECTQTATVKRGRIYKQPLYRWRSFSFSYFCIWNSPVVATVSPSHLNAFTVLTLSVCLVNAI